MTPTFTQLTYGPSPADTAHAFTPTGAIKGTIILIHGGSWVSGNNGSLDPIAAMYAKAGFRVLNIDYTLATNGHTWADSYASVRAAVAYARANYPGPVGAVGFSAGAQLAATLGASGQVDFVGDNSGPVTMGSGMDPTLAGIAQSIGAQSVKPQPGSAPVFITQGWSDPTVAASQAWAFDRALQAAGVSATLLDYAGAHVMRGCTAVERAHILNAEIAWCVQMAAGMPAGVGEAGGMAPMGVAVAAEPVAHLAVCQSRL